MVRGSACPHSRAPGAPVPDGRTIAPTQAGQQDIWAPPSSCRIKAARVRALPGAELARNRNRHARPIHTVFAPCKPTQRCYSSGTRFLPPACVGLKPERDRTTRTLRPKLLIITPVFDDWQSLRALSRDITEELSDADYTVEILAIDDCSLEHIPRELPFHFPVVSFNVLRLRANLGHQRAIAVGLSSISEPTDVDLVVVMDSDGEDRPAELKCMIRAAREHRGAVILAERTKRSEGLRFRFLYSIYTSVFRLFTGYKLRFANFCIIPFQYIPRIVGRSDLWNNFAAAIIRARLPSKLVPTVRGERYAGRSKMNLLSLIVHGLGAMSVFSDILLARILILSLFFLMLVVLALTAAFCVRIFTDLAVPGWTTNVFGFLILLGFNAVMLPLMMAFLHLSGRAGPQTIPCDSYAQFVLERTELSSDVKK